MKKVITRKQAADNLNCSTKTVDRLIKENRIFRQNGSKDEGNISIINNNIIEIKWDNWGTEYFCMYKLKVHLHHTHIYFHVFLYSHV